MNFSVINGELNLLIILKQLFDAFKCSSPPVAGASGKHVCNWDFEKCMRKIRLTRQYTGTLMRHQPLNFSHINFTRLTQHSSRAVPEQFPELFQSSSRAVPEQFQADPARSGGILTTFCPLPVHFLSTSRRVDFQS
jgi:hypothetical protein